jgi:hypothetical protein
MKQSIKKLGNKMNRLFIVIKARVSRASTDPFQKMTRDSHGANLLGSLGNIELFLIFLRPK